MVLALVQLHLPNQNKEQTFSMLLKAGEFTHKRPPCLPPSPQKKPVISEFQNLS